MCRWILRTETDKDFPKKSQRSKSNRKRFHLLAGCCLFIFSIFFFLFLSLLTVRTVSLGIIMSVHFYLNKPVSLSVRTPTNVLRLWVERFRILYRCQVVCQFPGTRSFNCLLPLFVVAISFFHGSSGAFTVLFSCHRSLLTFPWFYFEHCFFCTLLPCFFWHFVGFLCRCRKKERSHTHTHTAKGDTTIYLIKVVFCCGSTRQCVRASTWSTKTIAQRIVMWMRTGEFVWRREIHFFCSALNVCLNVSVSVCVGSSIIVLKQCTRLTG